MRSLHEHGAETDEPATAAGSSTRRLGLVAAVNLVGFTVELAETPEWDGAEPDPHAH